jgi:small-conductance mechanosensitive channel
MPDMLLFLDAIRHPFAWQEVVALLGVLTASYFIARTMGRKTLEESVWLGRNGLDGLLFPSIAFLGSYVLKIVFQQQQHSTGVLLIALPLLGSLALIRLMARVLSAVFPDSPFIMATERTFSWLAWIFAALWITGGLPWVLSELEAIQLHIGKTHVDLRTLIEGFLSSLLVLVLALWLSATIERKLLNRAISDLSIRKIATNALRALVLVVGLLIALSAVGVDLTALSVLGGALGVGLGFGLQKLAANYVSGFVILMERSLRIGDQVIVDGFEGQVTDIKTRFTLIRSPNGHESIVPNETMMTQRVENLSLQDPNIMLLCPVCVSYKSDVDQVSQMLVDVAKSTPRVLAQPAPVALLEKLGADGLEFQLAFWINDPAKGRLNVKSDVNRAVFKALQQANIEIPYPQRVIHMEKQGQ